MRKLALVAAILVVPLLLALPAFADYPDNFDGYPSPTVSPFGPWSFTSDSALCWSTFNTEVAASTSALSAPNVFQFEFDTACSGSHHTGNLTEIVNATSSVLSFSFFSEGTTPSVSGGSFLYLYLCPAVGSCPLSDAWGIYDLTSTPATWTQYSHPAKFATVPGHSYRIRLSINVSSTESGDFGIFVDNTFAKGGDAVMPGADLFLVNCQTNRWFNISGFKNSYVKVSFPSSPPVYYYNVTAPDLNITTTGANLLTVWVGNDYFATIIPGAVKNTIYLCPPASPVLFYTVYVQDFSNQFPPGTTVRVFDGSREIRSGYTDAGSNFAVWMVPGNGYSVELTHDGSTYVSNLTLPSVSGSTIPVQILKVTIPSKCGTQCTVSYTAGFNPGKTAILVILNDTSVSTSSITITVHRNNGTTFSVYGPTTFSPGPWGNFMASIPCNSVNCNATIADQLTVHLAFISFSGPESVTLPVSGGALNGLTPPNDIWGWKSVAPGVSVPTFFSFFIVLAAGGSFGAFHSKFGVIPVAGVTTALTYYGFLAIPMGAAAFLFAIAVFAFVGWLVQGH